jgi:ParB family chromosome partitioning protein
MIPEPAPLLIPLEQIDPSPRNPRRKLDGIEDLAESLRTYGLLQPPVVRPVGERFELVAGHRRLAAARALGWTHIPVLVRTAEQDEAYLLTLVENLQRDDLTAREEARALETLLRERGWTTRQVAAAVHRSPAYVSKRLRVFEDAVLAPLVIGQQLTVSAAEELLRLRPAQRRALAERAVHEGWQHAQVRAAVQSRFESKRRQPTLLRLGRELRHALQGISPAMLNEAERRELRILFRDLALLARAPTEARSPVFPPLPKKR